MTMNSIKHRTIALLMMAASFANAQDQLIDAELSLAKGERF
jgi:hypothetical protein